MTFTKQHYKAIAKILYEVLEVEGETKKSLDLLLVIAEKLADYFIQDNRNFDRKRFFDAVLYNKVKG